MKCNFQWYAPFLLPPPSTGVINKHQTCILDKGHDGDHKSVYKVTHPNQKVENRGDDRQTT